MMAAVTKREEPMEKKPKIEILPKVGIKCEEGGGAKLNDSGAAAVKPPSGYVPSSDAPVLPSVQMFDTEVVYRRCGSLILFKTESVLKLIQKWLKLSFNIRNVVSNPESHRKCEALKSPLISWGSLKLVLNGIIHDLALSDLMALYRPFQEEGMSYGEESSAPQHGVVMIGTSGTGFSVNKGKVYLNIDDIREMCKEREESMLDIKFALDQANVSVDDAYLKIDDSVNTSKILLSYVFLALPEESKAAAILRHLESRVEGVRVKRDSLLDEMEQTVNMINRQNITHQACINTVTESTAINNNTTPIKKRGGGGVGPVGNPVPQIRSGGLRRTYKECTNSQCGRMYHFIVSCCSLEHVMELTNFNIPYMYHKGKIFLEKCSAFEAIGKTSVIRCSNYRRVDKILMEYGLNPGDEFLQQEKFAPKRPRRRKLRHPENSKIGRNRRQHVSLAALSVLIEANFITGNNQGELLKSLHRFTDSLESDPGPRCRFLPSDGATAEQDIEEVVELSDEESGAAVKMDSSEAVNNLGLKKEERKQEPDNTGIEEDNKSSSGVESEDEAMLETPPLSNTPSPEPEAAQVKQKKSTPSVTMLDIEVPYKVLNDVLYLKKTAVFKLLQLKGSPRKMNESLDKLIQDSGFSLEKAFLYEGRLANFVSTLAIRQLLGHANELSSNVNIDLLITEINRVESNVESLAVIKYLHLKTMGTIKYQTQDDVVYFDTLRVMRLACIQPAMLKNSPSKANAFVKKLLQDRGVNVNACFLRQRQSKYAFINLRSALILLQYASENENKEKAYRLKKELLLAANNKNILNLRSSHGNQSNRIPHNHLKISPTLPEIKYKIKGGMMYFHRKTVYECIGLESIILGTKKGFLPINTIITELGFDFSQVYLSNQQEVFAYMCAPAIVLLLEAMDPIMVMLPKRLDFLVQLCLAVEFSVCSTLGSRGSIIVDNNKVPWITREGRLYFDRDTVFGLSKLLLLSDWADDLVQTAAAVTTAAHNYQADQQLLTKVQDMVAGKGLELEKDFVGKGGDPTAYIGFHAILSLFAQEGDYARSRDAHSLVLRDTLSAISSYEPKLRYHTRMSHFRMCLVNRVVNEFLRSLQEQGAGLELDTEQEESGLELDNLSDDEQLHQAGQNGARQLDHSSGQPRRDQHGQANGSSLGGETEEGYGVRGEDGGRKDIERGSWIAKIRADLLSLTGGKIGGSIGDWELVSIEPVTQLSVRAGYGAARKLSFMQSDVAAILKYDLYISRDSCQLSINDHRIVDPKVDEMMARCSQGGGLSVLYQLISLRPCFGSFGPEVVETVSQNLELGDLQNYPFTVDTNFIGTSSQGRTYAGTVRSLDCSYLAKSRVADRCAACSRLDTIVINRSILSGEVELKLTNPDSDEEGGELKPAKPSHQSVWKLVTADERGWSFLCPQVQTFNCSLPHAFDGSAQATTIVDHKVEISHNLEPKVTLCSKHVTCEFPQFSEDPQLSPVLNKVAALRLCVGYPSRRLVKQARYILNHMGRMLPEMRKLFKYFTVDDDFIYRVGHDEEIGTIRSINCAVESEDGSDICLACRGLQQPIEFQ